MLLAFVYSVDLFQLISFSSPVYISFLDVHINQMFDDDDDGIHHIFPHQETVVGVFFCCCCFCCFNHPSGLWSTPPLNFSCFQHLCSKFRNNCVHVCVCVYKSFHFIKLNFNHNESKKNQKFFFIHLPFHVIYGDDHYQKKTHSF